MQSRLFSLSLSVNTFCGDSYDKKFSITMNKQNKLLGIPIFDEEASRFFVTILIRLMQTVRYKCHFPTSFVIVYVMYFFNSETQFETILRRIIKN